MSVSRKASAAAKRQKERESGSPRSLGIKNKLKSFTGSMMIMKGGGSLSELIVVAYRSKLARRALEALLGILHSLRTSRISALSKAIYSPVIFCPSDVTANAFFRSAYLFK